MATYSGTSLKFVQNIYVENLGSNSPVSYNVPSGYYLILSGCSYNISISSIYNFIQAGLTVNNVVVGYKIINMNGPIVITFSADLSGGIYCPGPTTITAPYLYANSGTVSYYNSVRLIGALFTNG